MWFYCTICNIDNCCIGVMMVKIGVFGGRRGDCMIEWCKKTGLAEIVAVCERDGDVVDALKKKYPDSNIAYYADFDGLDRKSTRLNSSHR